MVTFLQCVLLAAYRPDLVFGQPANSYCGYPDLLYASHHSGVRATGCGLESLIYHMLKGINSTNNYTPKAFKSVSNPYICTTNKHVLKIPFI